MTTIHSIVRIAVPIMLGMATVPWAAAQSIFKCVDGETTAYQSMPCANGQTEVRLMTVARASSADAQPQSLASIPRVDDSVPTAQSRGRMWPFRRTLMLGMSDDEVLNLAGWGVPKRISRTRAPREWREEWSYGPSMNGERRLHFVNSTLVEVVDVPPSQQLASLTLQ